MALRRIGYRHTFLPFFVDFWEGNEDGYSRHPAVFMDLDRPAFDRFAEMGPLRYGAYIESNIVRSLPC